MTKMTSKTMIVVRALRWTGDLSDAYEEILSRTEGFGGGAKNAMEKSRDEDGDDGVTMIAGNGDFSVASGRERSVSAS
jgi:hypothetical protein